MGKGIRYSAAAVLLSAAIILGGVTASASSVIGPEEPLYPPTPTGTVKNLLTLPASAQVTPTAFGRKGTIAFDSGLSLTTEQKEVIFDYMDGYFESLSSLRAGDPTYLFASDASVQALGNKIFWEIMVSLRSMQNTNLHLTDYSYTLKVKRITKQQDGDLFVELREGNIQNFAAYPGVDAEHINIAHQFTLTNTSSGWKIRRHLQLDSMNFILFESLDDSMTTAEKKETLLAQQESIVADARKNVRSKAAQLESYNPNQTTKKKWENDYSRRDAVNYAAKWVGYRNTSWPIYDHYGGNCVNFTSQAMRAGGIPMDYTGSAQWKWYGETINSNQSATGRSSSWSGVKEFYTYAKNNTGYGLVAEVDYNFYGGANGDIIQMGLRNDWRHQVIVTRVLRDSAGNTVDYLINSNTADRRNFPVSAYEYTQQRMVKIHGWNSSGK